MTLLPHSTALGTIIQYDPATDTCTVELTGAGVLDVWVAGIPIAASINRAYAVYGAGCTLDVPDPHHLSDLTITGIATQANLSVQSPTGPVLTLTGSASLQTDANGGMNPQQITFQQAFSAAPTVSAGGEFKWTISGITVSSFDVTLAAGNNPPNSSFLLTWSAQGQG